MPSENVLGSLGVVYIHILYMNSLFSLPHGSPWFRDPMPLVFRSAMTGPRVLGGSRSSVESFKMRSRQPCSWPGDELV